MKRTNNQHDTSYILTNDPSMTAWGWAVILPNGMVIETGAIKTQPLPKKLNVRKGDDRIRRIKELTSVLLGVIDTYNIQLILSEQPHGSQSASAALMIGMTAAIVQTIGDCKDIAVEWFSEGDAKKAISGRRSVQKNEMISLIAMKYKVDWTKIGWRDEAVADAIAVYHVATQQSEVLRFLR